MTTPVQLPYWSTREDSPFQFLGLPTLIRATGGDLPNGAFGLIENWMMPPGFASPYPHTPSRR